MLLQMFGIFQDNILHSFHSFTVRIKHAFIHVLKEIQKSEQQSGFSYIQPYRHIIADRSEQ